MTLIVPTRVHRAPRALALTCSILIAALILCFAHRPPALADEPAPGAADVDGDGVEDVGFGDPGLGLDPPEPGQVVALSGVDGALLWRATGEHGGDCFGFSAVLIADLNGDGVGAVLASAPDRAVALPARLGGAHVLDGATGDFLRTHEGDPGDWFGLSVSVTADRDADGVPDYAVYGLAVDELDRQIVRKSVYSGATGLRLYSLSILRDEAEGGLVPGDVNSDGVVDAGDLAQVVQSIGQTGDDLPEDVSANSIVDAPDVSTTLANVGQTSATPLDSDGDEWPDLGDVIPAICGQLSVTETYVFRPCPPGNPGTGQPGSGSGFGDLGEGGGSGDGGSSGGSQGGPGSDDDDDDEECQCGTAHGAISGAEIISVHSQAFYCGELLNSEGCEGARLWMWLRSTTADLEDAYFNDSEFVIVAGAGPGIATIKAEWTCGGQVVATTERKVWVAAFDLDIDSDNSNDFDLPDGTPEEEEVEDADPDDDHPGKVILVNSWDTDGDGVEDLVDGYDFIPLLEQDDVIEGGRFTPLLLDAASVPDTARLALWYDAADPMEVLFGDSGWETEGSLRLWLLDAAEARDGRAVLDGGDFVAPGEYGMSDLLLAGGGSITLYVEAVNPSAAIGDKTISVALDLLGDGQWATTDVVRVTAVRVELQSQAFGEDLFRPSACLIPTHIAYAGGSLPLSLPAGAYMTHRFVVNDPRDLGGGSFDLGGAALPLAGAIGVWMTPEFWTPGALRPAEATLIPPALEIETPNLSEGADWTYSIGGEAALREQQATPRGRARKIPVDPLSEADEIMAAALRDSITEMESQGWTPANPNYSGAFGDEAHARSFAKLAGRPDWYASVWVNVDTGEILSIGAVPQGASDIVEIDVMKTKPGYAPAVGQVLDVAQVEEAYEIKTGVNGDVDIAKRDKLNALLGHQRWKVPTPERMYKVGIGFVDHPKGGKIFKYFALFGLAQSGYAVFHASQYDDQLDDLVRTYEDAENATTDVWRDLAAVELANKTRQYLNNFTADETFANVVTVGMIYEHFGWSR